jgi:hypothetical protein
MSKDDVLPTDATDAARSAPGDSDRVGYCQPPKHSRFKPGQSGNPSGRPKSRPSFGKELVAKLLMSVPDRDETKWGAMCENVANAGVANTAIALKIIPLVISIFKDNAEDDGELTAEQTALVQNFEARQELSKSATQSEQSTNEHFENGDDHEQEIS